MARNPKKPSDNYIFSSEENLEKQAKIMEDLADKVARHMERSFESVSRRLSESQEKELNKWDKIVESATTRYQEGQKGSGMSFKQNMAANILNQTGPGQKFDANLKSVGVTIGKTILEGLSDIFNIYFTKPIQQGFHDMSSAYESNFSEIAGRMGLNRNQTYNIMKDTVNSLTGSLKNAIDANNELIPELRKVSGQGFTGDKAMSQALANVVDAKLMPWLDTASDTWANLSFNLSKTQMQQIKGQQLLLQETQSGNRLLQSGIINQLTNDIAPVLTNIDLNTGGAQNLAPEAQAHMVSLMDQGYSAQEAYAAVQENLKVWKDPTAGFDKGDYSSVMKSQAAILGGDYSDIASADAYGHNLAAGAGINAGFIQHALGLNLATGIYRAEGSSQYLKGLYGTDWDLFKNKDADEVYQSLADRVAEKVTATQSYDNWWKNTTTQAAYGLNSWAHGPDVIETGFKTLIKIGESILGFLVGKSVLSWATGGKFGTSTEFTGKQGLLNASRAGSSSFTTGADVGLKSGGLVGGLAQGGANMTGLSGGAATAAGAATFAGGALMTGYGVTNAVKDFKSQDYAGSAMAGIGAIGGGVGIAGALGLVSGPVGWVGLGVGAVALAVRQVYKVNKELSGASKKLIESYENQKDIITEETNKRKSLVSTIEEQINKNPDNPEEAKKSLVDSGIVSAEKANKMSAEDISTLLDELNYIESKAEYKTNSKLSEQSELESKNNTETIKQLTNVYDLYDGVTTSAISSALESKADWNGNVAIEKGSEVDSLIQWLTNNLANDPNDTEERNNERERLKNIILKDASDNEINIHDLESYMTGRGHIGSKYGKWTDFESRSNSGAQGLITDIEEWNKFFDKEELKPFSKGIDNKLVYHSESEMSDMTEKTRLEAWLEEAYNTNVRGTKIYEDNKKRLKELGGDVSSYAVGTPYLYHDTVAQLHEGEAVLTKNENKKRLAGLLGLNNKSTETSNLSATEIVNAITSQTNELKQAINEIINAITSSSKQISFSPRTNNSIEMMMPTIANTRNLGVR